MKKRDSRIVNLQLTKRTLESFKSSTLDMDYEIRAIDPIIHRLGLPGDHGYRDLEERFGKLKIDDTYQPEKRMPKYKTKAYLHTQVGNLPVFLNPVEPYLPRCILEVPYPEREFLVDLSWCLPKLKVYSVEYAIDLYCCDLMEAENLLWLLKRYLYVPYKRSTKEYGELLFQVGEGVGVQRISPQTGGVENEEDVEPPVYRSGNLKVYLRGPDELKRGRSWFHRHVDRVRVELTPTRSQLRRHNIRRLKDFIRAPKFKAVCENILNFKKFRDSSKRFPREWEGYRSGSFQEEFIQQRKNGVKNPSQYMTDAEGFDEFKPALVEATEEFDREWDS